MLSWLGFRNYRQASLSDWVNMSYLYPACKEGQVLLVLYGLALRFWLTVVLGAEPNTVNEGVQSNLLDDRSRS